MGAKTGFVRLDKVLEYSSKVAFALASSNKSLSFRLHRLHKGGRRILVLIGIVTLREIDSLPRWWSEASPRRVALLRAGGDADQRTPAAFPSPWEDLHPGAIDGSLSRQIGRGDQNQQMRHPGGPVLVHGHEEEHELWVVHAT
eukprot:scaffold3071_cov253-Pinguiococcus_pyrenoidosus.AAC.1